MRSSLAAARDTARGRARILRRRRANLADTRPFPLVHRARRACAGRRIAGGGHATHTRARDLACSDAATLLRKRNREMETRETRPARALFRARIRNPRCLAVLEPARLREAPAGHLARAARNRDVAKDRAVDT